MKTFFQSRKKRRDQAQFLYQQCTVASRATQFYTDFGVKDDFNGRYEMLCLHVAPVIHCLFSSTRKQDKMLGQALWKHVLRSVDVSLRENNVGDMGVSKRVKKYAKFLQARVVLYGYCLEEDDEEELSHVLQLNVCEGAKVPEGLLSYAKRILKALKENKPQQGMAADHLERLFA